ncbi:MAG: hypothetical protein HQL94_11820, partial [Magnetococcales bacterium]|nr:hypothetical protein [Magnetococcales bacterium]
MNTLRSLWQLGWRRTTLTVKAVIITIIMGILFWIAMDSWQTEQVKTILHIRLLNELEIQAQSDRLLFDSYIRSQEQSINLFAQRTAISQYVESMEPTWIANPGWQKQWNSDNKPPWLPSKSVMRGLIAAPFILLLDGQKRIRESFYRTDSLPPLPDTLLNQALPELLMANENNSIRADPNGTVYLISISAVEIEQVQKAFLAMIAPINTEFLSIFHVRTEINSIVALINGENNRVFASSKPNKVMVGTTKEQLASHYRISGKILNYGSTINIPLHFVTLAPIEE